MRLIKSVIGPNLKNVIHQVKLALYPVAGFFGLYRLYYSLFYPDTGEFVSGETLFFVILLSPFILIAGLIGAGIIVLAYVPWIRQINRVRRIGFFFWFTAIIGGLYFVILNNSISSSCRTAQLNNDCNFLEISAVFFIAYAWLCVMAGVIFDKVDKDNGSSGIDA